MLSPSQQLPASFELIFVQSSAKIPEVLTVLYCPNESSFPPLMMISCKQIYANHDPPCFGIIKDPCKEQDLSSASV